MALFELIYNTLLKMTIAKQKRNAKTEWSEHTIASWNSAATKNNQIRQSYCKLQAMNARRVAIKKNRSCIFINQVQVEKRSTKNFSTG